MKYIGKPYDHSSFLVGQYYRIKRDAPDDFVGEIRHPFCGVPVKIIDRFGMTYAGTDATIELQATRGQLAILHSLTSAKFVDEWLDMYKGTSHIDQTIQEYQHLYDPDKYYIEINCDYLEPINPCRYYCTHINTELGEQVYNCAWFDHEEVLPDQSNCFFQIKENIS